MGIKIETIKSKKSILSIISLTMVAIFDILIIITLIMARNYYGLATTISILVILCAVLIILMIDILGIVGFIYDDLKLNIIGISISFIFVVVISITMFYLATINNSINGIVDNKGSDQYETIGVTLACYKDNYTDINDCENKNIGILSEAEVGSASLFKDKAEKEGIKAKYSEYNSTSDLFFALITDEIDVGVFPSNYRLMYKNDEESDFSEYLDNVTDFYSFEEKVKTGENKLANEDLTLKPFNVLLIGFAPEEGSNGKYGLADTIIVATINPKTLEVGLTSIARDSYVPISCYSGYRDKINAARGKSRECLMDTVGELLDLDIDLYMEANFKAVVEIVDAVGGIDINSPVAFIGQTSSEVRGTYTIQIPKGYYHANGEEALAYARERHAMPAGDFDRQEHQKEVIGLVLEKVLEARDPNTIMNIIKACGENLSTNISIQQITQFFNYIIKLKNYTTLDLSRIVDMQNARLTGYSSWYYNYSASLPLWIYKLYDGSIEEAKAHINDIMKGYHYEYKENLCAKFFTYYPYTRPPFYSMVFNEAQDNEEMPSFYKNLTNMSYSEVLEWASANGVSVNLQMILPGDSGYDESRLGSVISQSVPYGSLVSDYPSVTITVMGDVTGSVSLLPNFVGSGYSSATSWCNEKGIPFSITWLDNSNPSQNGLVVSQSVAAGTVSSKISSIDIQVYKYASIPSDVLNQLNSCVGTAAVSSWSNTYGYAVNITYQTTTIQADDGKIVTLSLNTPGTAKPSVNIVMYSYTAPVNPEPQPVDPEEDPGTNPEEDPGTNPEEDPGTNPEEDPSTNPEEDPSTTPGDDPGAGTGS